MAPTSRGHSSLSAMDLFRRMPVDLTETTALGGLLSICAGYVCGWGTRLDRGSMTMAFGSVRGVVAHGRRLLHPQSVHAGALPGGAGGLHVAHDGDHGRARPQQQRHGEQPAGGLFLGCCDGRMVGLTAVSLDSSDC